MLILNHLSGFGGIADTSSNLVTTLYTGTGLARDINTGQNLAAGGLVWGKNRNSLDHHRAFDTKRGANLYLTPSQDFANLASSQAVTSFNGNGVSLGTDIITNTSGQSYVLWSFLQKAGFMDIVEYIGNGTNQTLSHDLDSTVGLMLVKSQAATSSWRVYHTSIGNTKSLVLNNNSASAVSSIWNNTSPTSTQFTVGNLSDVNGASAEYIAYLFAHNPSQGIACGSFTTDVTGNVTVNLGFRPKWILLKDPDSASSDWFIWDVARNWGNNTAQGLTVSRSAAEYSDNGFGTGPSSSGFQFYVGAASEVTYLYMAIG